MVILEEKDHFAEDKIIHRDTSSPGPPSLEKRAPT